MQFYNDIFRKTFYPLIFGQAEVAVLKGLFFRWNYSKHFVQLSWPEIADIIGRNEYALMVCHFFLTSSLPSTQSH